MIGADVSAMRSTGARMGPADWSSTVSGVDGRFVIDGLADGEYRPGASHRCYLRGRPAAALTLPAEATPMVELRLEPSGRLEGRIISQGIAGRNPSGAEERTGKAGPRVQRSVTLDPVDGDGEDPGNRRFFQHVNLDPDGRFTADSVPPARYRLVLKAQAMGETEFVSLGPTGGVGSAKPLGPEKLLWSGEIEIEPRKTTLQDITYQPAE